MGTLAFIAPAWLGRDVETADADLTTQGYQTYSYGLISSGGVKKDPATSEDTKYVWKFNDDWNQWKGIEEKSVMIMYAVGLLFILISLWNIAITECVPIKNQSTMLIMIVVWDVLAASCIAAAVLAYCSTWDMTESLKEFCGSDLKKFSPGTCELQWGLYGAVASACAVIFVTGLNIIACYQAKTQRRDAAFRHM